VYTADSVGTLLSDS